MRNREKNAADDDEREERKEDANEKEEKENEDEEDIEVEEEEDLFLKITRKDMGLDLALLSIVCQINIKTRIRKDTLWTRVRYMTRSCLYS